MKVIRSAISFVAWLFVGWLWLLFVSLLVGGVVAFTIEYFLVSPSSPAYVGYLISGLSVFAATLLALFATRRTKRLVTGVLVAAVALGAADVITALLAHFGADVPRFGFLSVLGGSSPGVGAQLVNGVALLAGSAVFLFARELDAAERRKTAADGAAVASESAATSAASDVAATADEPSGEAAPADEAQSIEQPV